MKKFFLAASALTLGLGVAACDSPAENAMEDEATAIDEAAEAQADAMEDAGTITDEQADAIEEQGEETKDAMEEQADDMDAAPQ